MATLQFTSRPAGGFNTVKPINSNPMAVMNTLPSQRPTQLFGEAKSVQPQPQPQQQVFMAQTLPGQAQLAQQQQQQPLPPIPSTASSPQMVNAQAVPYGGYTGVASTPQYQPQQTQQPQQLQQQLQMQQMQQMQLQQQQQQLQMQQMQQQQLQQQQMQQPQQQQQVLVPQQQQMAVGQQQVAQMQPQAQMQQGMQMQAPAAAGGVVPAVSSQQVKMSFQQFLVLPIDTSGGTFNGSPVLVQRGVPASDQVQLVQSVVATKKKSDAQKRKYILLFGMMGYMMWRNGSMGDGRLYTRLEPTLQQSNQYLMSRGVNVRFAWVEGTLRAYYK